MAELGLIYTTAVLCQEHCCEAWLVYLFPLNMHQILEMNQYNFLTVELTRHHRLSVLRLLACVWGCKSAISSPHRKRSGQHSTVRHKSGGVGSLKLLLILIHDLSCHRSYSVLWITYSKIEMCHFASSWYTIKARHSTHHYQWISVSVINTTKSCTSQFCLRVQIPCK